MTDYFLRADDEPALQSALKTMGLWYPQIPGKMGLQGGYLTGGVDDRGAWALDVIGAVYKPQKDASGAIVTAKDAMGNLAPVMVARPGFHANLRWLSDLPLTAEVEALTLTPDPVNPSRIFA